jgi:pilus assembly protein CpaE
VKREPETAMNQPPLKVSVLFGSGQENPELPEVLRDMAGLKFLKQALSPETFLSQHADTPPDLALVDLDGISRVPDWLEQVIAQFPRTHVVVCSQSRDPDFLISLMKMKVGAFVPLPLDRQELQAVMAQARLALEQEQARAALTSQIVMATGTKGGVGVTSIAANLAVALAERHPTQVVLVDLARPFPHVGQFLDLKGQHTIMDLLHSVDSLDPEFIQKTVHRHKSSLDVLLSSLDDPLGAGSLADAQSLKKVLTALRGSYAWIVVDLGCWIDYLYAALLKEADQVLLVTELSVPDLFGLKRLKGLYTAWDVDEQKLNVVLNRYDKDYTLGLKDLENIFLRPVFATLPSDYAALIDAINQGIPLGEAAPRSRLWRGLKKMANDLVAQGPNQPGQKSSGGKGFLRRLFR